MGALTRLMWLIVFIMFFMAVAMAAQGPEGAVVLKYGATELTTSIPIALGMVILCLVLAYYGGQMMHWLGGLPGLWRLRKGMRLQQSTLRLIGRALAAERLGMADAARLMLTMREGELPTHELNGEEKRLLGISELLIGRAPQDALLGPIDTPLAGAVENDDIGQALVRLVLAKNEAEKANWVNVRNECALGLELCPESPRLLSMKFKALVNLDETEAAEKLLPKLKHDVNAETYRLLGDVLAARSKPEEHGVRVLTHPWTHFFVAWLANSDDKIPQVISSTNDHAQGHTKNVPSEGTVATKMVAVKAK